MTNIFKVKFLIALYFLAFEFSTINTLLLRDDATQKASVENIVDKGIILTQSKLQEKEQLLSNAAKLESSIAVEVNKLQTSGDNRSATALQNESLKLQEISTALKSANNEVIIKALEIQLRLFETRVAQDLKQLERGFLTVTHFKTTQTITSFTETSTLATARNMIDELLEKARVIQKSVGATILKLKEQKKDLVATSLQNDLTKIIQFAAALKNCNTNYTIKFLEKELNLLEMRLSNEIRTIELESQAKDILLTRALELENNITIEVEKLESTNKTQVGSVLKRERLRLEAIAHALQITIDKNRTQILENELQLAENRVSQELRRSKGESLNHLKKRDLKSDLSKRANALLHIANGVIKKLAQDNRSELQGVIQHIQKRVEDITYEVNDVHLPESLKILREELDYLEKLFAKEVKLLELESETKERVLLDADKLQSEIKSEIIKLETLGRNDTAEYLRNESEELEEISLALKSANTEVVIKALEANFRLFQINFSQKLKQLETTNSTTKITTPTAEPTPNITIITNSTIVTSTLEP